MDPAISLSVIALCTAIATMAGQIWNSRSQSKQRQAEKAQEFELRSKEKAEDYARQDEVAARQEESSRKALESTERSAKASLIGLTKIGGTVDQIHELTNSGKDEQLQENLEGREAILVLLKQLQQVRKEGGHEPTDEDIAQVKALEANIASRKIALADRKKVTDNAAATKIEFDKKIDHDVTEAFSEVAKAREATLGESASKMVQASKALERTADKADITTDKIIAKVGSP